MRQALAKSVVLAACLSGWGGGAAFANEGGLILPPRSGGPVKIVLEHGLQGRAPAEALQVFVGAPRDCCTGRTPIAGTYRVDDRTITFSPVFSFDEGQSYTVLSHASAQGPVRTEFTLGPEAGLPPPEIVALYPSGPEIPENTLRFYIHFSRPMAPHVAADFIRLVDARGTNDPDAFMSFTQELWNEDRTRLTLLMDPGRIKRGVAQNRTLGPALEAGARHAIVVEAGWSDARATGRTRRFEKPFAVSAPLRTLPHPDQWRIAPPPAASMAPLTITFDRPFDHQLAQTAIRLRDMDGQSVPGEVTIDNHEKRWRFHPVHPWHGAAVQLVVDGRLEDVAGNNFRDLLDHAVESVVNDIDHVTLTVPFAQ